MSINDVHAHIGVYAGASMRAHCRATSSQRAASTCPPATGATAPGAHGVGLPGVALTHGMRSSPLPVGPLVGAPSRRSMHPPAARHAHARTAQPYKLPTPAHMPARLTPTNPPTPSHTHTHTHKHARTLMHAHAQAHTRAARFAALRPVGPAMGSAHRVLTTVLTRYA